MTSKQGTPADAELKKWAAAQPSLSTLRDFLEWLDEQKLEVAAWRPSGNWMMPVVEDRERMLARYLGIDLNALEHERRALLEKCG